MTIADEVFRVEGMGINDGQFAHYNGLPDESLSDAEYRFLSTQAFVDTGQLQDMWFQFLTLQGFDLTNGVSVPDMELLYWKSK
jgi:hypothetical protein